MLVDPHHLLERLRGAKPPFDLHLTMHELVFMEEALAAKIKTDEVKKKATITRYPAAVEEAPTGNLRWIDRPKFDMVGAVYQERVLQWQWKFRSAATWVARPDGSYQEGPGVWQFEWRDVPFDPHGGP